MGKQKREMEATFFYVLKCSDYESINFNPVYINKADRPILCRIFLIAESVYQYF